MLLTIDIGNSTIAWGLFKQGGLTGPWRIATDPSRTAESYGGALADEIRSAGTSPEQVSGAILCSVVPALTPVVAEAVRHRFRRRPLIVSSDMDTGLTLRYADPRELGADRLANAAAAHDRYRTDLIVVDLGTATTFTVVTEAGECLGGAIAPGLGISAEALSGKTAQLPRVKLRVPPHVVGRDTVGSIQSGLVHGQAALVDGLVARLQDELGRRTLVVATGGFSSLIAPLSRTIQEVRPHLTLEGLELLARRATDHTSSQQPS